MKALWKSLLGATAVVALFSVNPTTVSAQDEAPAAQQGEGRRGRGNFDPAQFFARMDQNGDGIVSKDEFRGPEDRFAELDKDGDGKATKEEFEAARASMTARRGNGDQPGRGGFGPGGFDIDAAKDKLGASDEEWAILKPRIEKVNGLVRPGRGVQNPEMETLRTALASAETMPEQLEKAVADLRKARETRQADLKAAREELRGIVTPKQEAQLIIDGILD